MNATTLQAKAACIAEKIIADYLEHYPLPYNGESHLHDCITEELEKLMADPLQPPAPGDSFSARIAEIENAIQFHPSTVGRLARDREIIPELIACVREQQAALLDVQALIAYQFSGSQDAMNALQLAADRAHSVHAKWRLE